MENIEEDSMLELEAQRENSTIRRNKRQLRALAICLSIVFVLVCIFMVMGMLAESVYIYTGVEGKSMQPTINAGADNSDNPYDYVYVNTYQKGTYGDIIVVQHTDASGSSKYVIKRLLGMGGDTIKIDNTDSSCTKVYRNGELLEEDYLDLTRNAHFNGIMGNNNSVTSVTIPEGYIFYMGDNRNQSSDCRTYSYTEVPFCEKASNIVGRVDYIVPNAMVASGDGKDAERLWRGVVEIFNRIF